MNNNSNPSDIEDDTKIINQTGEEQKTIKEKEDLEDNSLITDQTDEDPIQQGESYLMTDYRYLEKCFLKTWIFQWDGQ